MKKSLIIILFCLFSMQSIHAMEVIPRIGADVVQQQYVYVQYQNNIVKKDNGVGINGGVLLVGNSFFLDLNLESANTNTLVNDDNTFAKGSRSEISAVLGYRLKERIWLTAGYQSLYYGSSFLKKDRGEMSAPKIGFSMTNMQQGDYLITVGFTWGMDLKSSNISGDPQEAGDFGGIRVALRKKGSPHIFSWKYTDYSPDFQHTTDNTTKFSYSYLFL